MTDIDIRVAVSNDLAVKQFLGGSKEQIAVLAIGDIEFSLYNFRMTVAERVAWLHGLSAAAEALAAQIPQDDEKEVSA